MGESASQRVAGSRRWRYSLALSSDVLECCHTEGLCTVWCVGLPQVTTRPGFGLIVEVRR